MSAPQIPNLSTLKRGGLRGRGRGGGLVAGDGRKSKDEIIQDTDNDAADSRLSAVAAGYLEDPFAKLLTPKVAQRRLPLMNRGTYVRTNGIDKIVEAFITGQSGRKQIISLGAGSDTRYFRLKRNHNNLDLLYHEIDFESNTKTKIDRIQGLPFKTTVQDLCSIDVDDYQTSGGELKSRDYNIHARDLRNLPRELPGVDAQLPTLLISECCLIYLSPEEAENVLEYFSGMFTIAPLAVAIYEPIRPGDSFGKTMVRNLVARGIHLQTLEKYADLNHQRRRLANYGFEPRAEDIDFIWRTWIEESEKERVDGLEWMDEIEEFILLAKHYCISWGWRGWIDDSMWVELNASPQNAHLNV